MLPSAKDAEACFHAATGLVVEAIGQDVREGRIVLNPRLIAYLEREGRVPAGSGCWDLTSDSTWTGCSGLRNSYAGVRAR